IEEFLYLYEKTFERQNIILQQNLLPQMRVLLSNLHASGDIKIYTAKNENGNVGSIAIFLLLNDTAYYLFGANDYALRAEHT
ncbi:GNAT family N-acetyltransferase, partial [Staphylococcus caprae]|uniref:GNAT family N-acetyltransferase n=1 Tax=Staphylococcus caprae TaxID=29380 RepID=UPI0033914AE7